MCIRMSVRGRYGMRSRKSIYDRFLKNDVGEVLDMLQMLAPVPVNYTILLLDAERDPCPSWSS